MFNAVNKIIICVSLAVTVGSCGSSESKDARSLVESAEAEVQAGRYEGALILLDTLDQKYASQVDIRRASMKTRAIAVEGVLIRRIEALDDSLAYLKAQIEMLGTQFEYVKNPGNGLGGDYIAKSILKTKSDLTPKVNDDGYFTLSVRIPGKPIGFQCVNFIDGASSAVTEPVSSSRLVAVDGSEITALQQEEVSRAVCWLAEHPDSERYELLGSKSTVGKSMSQVLRKAIVDTWFFAQSRQSYRRSLIEREKLERRLQLARNQIANAVSIPDTK